MRQDLRVLAFGDSLTEGYSNWGAQWTPYSESKAFEAILDATGDVFQIVVEGQSGDFAIAFRRRMEQRYSTTSTRSPLYDWAIVLGGTNDLAYGRGAKEIFDALVDISNIPLEHGAKVLMLTVPECQHRSEGLERRRTELNDLIMNDGRRNVYKLDLHAAIPYHAMDKEEREKIWDDGLHLTPEGYERMGKVVAERLVELIKETKE
ncbi:putative GDSL-like lipase/acylhydrolase [Calycina marina]|uniref:GDSL-like lipase/acylhydrolase n=1 Tax=Calycina marina TaxID=1763456 RepID=A0A9P7Z0Z8_9HELO|nr:putative GDSL-like lipase/acylhydrolase [Calycina marina]